MMKTLNIVNRPPPDDIDRRAEQLRRRRDAEANDALDFLFLGDADDRHLKRCVYALSGREPCSRDYDPYPVREAMPTNRRMYEDTGIAALYNLPGGAAHAWQLAGWNLRKENR